MAIKAYEAIEEKYYGLMDWLQDHRIPVYSVIDAFEERGVPTFPLFIIILIVLAFLAYSLLGGGMLSLNSTIEVNVKGSDGVALSGAEVIFQYAENAKTLTTGSAGTASLPVPYNSNVGISVSLPGYKDANGNLTADQLNKKFSVTLEALAKTVKKTIQFVDASGAQIKKELQLSFSCTGNTSFQDSKATSTGSLDIEVPADCGSINVASQNGFAVQGTGAIDLSDNAPKILLSEAVVETGSVLVNVQDQDQNALSGIQIKLVSDQGETIGPNTTGNSGSTKFEGIAAGAYYVVAYDGIYGTVETSNLPDGKKQVQASQMTEFTITMQKQGAGKIKLLVKDKVSGSGVQSANVALFKDNDKQITSKKTDSTGRVEFTVTENVNTYSVQVDSLQYLKATLAGISPSATEYSLELTQATASNSSTLSVSLSDEAGLPVEDARLKLNKVSDGSVVAETITGLDGKASFERLDEGSYFVYAFKPGYGEQTSGAIAVSTRQPNSLEMQIVIGSGTAELEVLDSEGNPLNGAIVRSFSQFSNQQVGAQQITGTDGKAEVNVRADKTVYLQVQANNLADYYTLPMQIPKGATKNVSVQMQQEPGSLGIELLGYYSGAEEASSSLAEGQKYTARLLLAVPSGENFTEAGVHFRTGSDDTDSVEKDAVYLKTGSAAGALLRKGSSYTKPSGYGTDLSHLTNGSAKWAELAIKNPKPGVYEAAFDVQVRSGTSLGAVLESHYRAWGKTGSSYIRFPVDNVLGENESITGKQALYAYTKTDILSVGPSTLCNDTFCYTFTIEDLGSNVKTSVIDEYSASISSSYRLYFSLTSRSGQAYGNSKLRIGSQGGGAQLGAYSVTIVGGAKRTGTILNNSLEVDAGSISNRDNVSGSIDFTAQKEGGTGIALSILSGSAVFQKSILVNVESANQMAVSVIPKTIIPFVQNDLLINATDDANNAIADASVTIRKNDAIIATGTTDSTGTFAYSLAAVNAGTTITIRIEKTGFAPFERKIVVSQDIITFAPEKVGIILIANGRNSIEKAVMVQNNTAIPLTVSGIKASADFSKMVKFSFADEYAGKALENGVDFNIDFIASLTDAGKQVTAPTTIKGSILLQVESTAQDKEWIAALPVEVRIGFGGEVDDSSCLVLGQKLWSISASKTPQTITLDLKNTCTVDSKPVSLQGLQAKATRANTNALGSYSVTSSIENSSSIVLTSKYSDLAPTLGQQGEYTLNITFTPADIVGGKANEKIILKANNPTNSSIEEITAQLDVSIVVSDLAQCVVVSQQKEIYINTCPFNTGYGNYGNYFQQSPFAPNPINPYQAYGYAPGGLQQQYYNNYPNSQFRAPNYNGFNYNQGISSSFANQSFCGQGEFRIANNCTSDVHIDLDAHPAVQASQTSFDLKPSEDKRITVEAGYRMGRYPIEVRAKVKDSAEAPLLLQTIQAIVQSFGEVNYDCIILDPAEKLSITEFIGKPIRAKVYNNCYDQGVRLNDSTQHPIDIYGTEYLGALNAQQQQAQLKMASTIKQIRALPKIVKPGSDNKLIEEMSFDVIPNIAWRDRAPLELKGSTAKQIGSMRMFITEGYYRVEEMADIMVHYSDPTGQALTKQFPIVIEDMYAATEFLDKVGIKGDPAITDKFERCLDQEKYSNAISVGWLQKENTYHLDLLLINETHCGSGDGISFNTKDGIWPAQTIDVDDRKYLVTAQVSNDRYGIDVTIKVLKGTPTQGDLLSFTIPFKVSRTDPPKTLSAGEIKFRIQISVQAQGETCTPSTKPGEVKVCPTTSAGGGTNPLDEGGGPITTTAVQYCGSGDGVTGTDAYNKYGFDKLLWTWDFDKIGRDSKNSWSCDTMGQGYYCDATQFQIELNKKGALIYSYAQKYANRTAPSLELVGSATDLPGVSKKKAIVQDYDIQTQKTAEYQLFMKSDSEFLEDNKLDPSTNTKYKNFVDLIKGVTTIGGGNVKGITKSTNDALQALSDDKNAERIIVLLNGMDSYANTLEELGAEKPALVGSSQGKKMASYVMTLNEYARMHNIIYQNKVCETATSCNIENKIKDLDGAEGQTVITAKFLADFYKNSKFIVGIKDSKSISTDDLRKVVKGAEDSVGVKNALPEGYKDFEAFYFDLIDFSANLKKDNINDSFVTDFAAVYADTFNTYLKSTPSIQDTVMVRENAEISESGTYAAIFKFGIKGRTPPIASPLDELNLTKVSGLPAGDTSDTAKPDYSKNPLFVIPFDGKVGFSADGTTVVRKGYGATYGKEAQTENENINLTMPSTRNMTPKEVNKLLVAPNDAAGSDALVKLDSQYLSPVLSGSALKQVNEDMRTGLIMSVSKTKLRFGASKPVPLQVKISSGGDGAWFGYNIAETQGILTSTSPGSNRFSNQNTWLDWDLACSTSGSTDFMGKTFAAKADELVRMPAGQIDLRGFNWADKTSKGAMVVRSLAVKPYGYSLVLGSLKAKDTARLWCENCDTIEGVKNIVAEGSKFVSFGAKNEAEPGATSIAQSFELLKGSSSQDSAGRACISFSSTDNSMSLKWNKGYYYGLLPEATCK